MKRVLLLASKPLGLRCAAAIHELAPESLAAIVTIDDRGDPRSAYDDFLAFGQRSKVTVHVAGDAAAAAALVARHAPDLVLVISWYWFVRKETLAAVPLGFIGIHFSMLPRYRGGSPLVWAVINGERESGVSLFTLAPRMDTGDIWDQRAFAIAPEATIADVLATAEETALQMLRDDTLAILDGTLRPRPQSGEASVVPMRKPEDGAIDWRQPARRVFDFIRAQTRPYPGAFTTAGQRRVHIWRARVGPARGGEAGDVVDVEGRPAVVCGDGLTIVVQDADGALQ